MFLACLKKLSAISSSPIIQAASSAFDWSSSFNIFLNSNSSFIIFCLNLTASSILLSSLAFIYSRQWLSCSSNCKISFFISSNFNFLHSIFHVRYIPYVVLLFSSHVGRLYTTRQISRSLYFSIILTMLYRTERIFILKFPFV